MTLLFFDGCLLYIFAEAAVTACSGLGFWFLVLGSVAVRISLKEGCS